MAAQPFTGTVTRVYRPGMTPPPATATGYPGRPRVSASPRTVRSWKDTPMATSTTPKPAAEDERELARRALQTSMDTRQ